VRSGGALIFPASVLNGYPVCVVYGFTMEADRVSHDEVDACQFVRHTGMFCSSLCQVEAGLDVLYHPTFDLVRELFTQDTLSAEAGMENEYLKPDMVIIDEWSLKVLEPWDDARAGPKLLTHARRSTPPYN
jgi:hypothetical protein